MTKVIYDMVWVPDQVEDESELWGQLRFRGQPLIWEHVEAIDHSQKLTSVLNIGSLDSIFDLDNSTFF